MKRRPNPALAGSLPSTLFLLLMSVATAGTNTVETPTYSTADGKHRGDITVTPLMSNQVADKMGKFRLSYALWTLVGEPVQDYLFSWDWPKGEITVGNAMIDGKQVPVTTKDLAKYPDLLGRFVAVKPVGLTLTASIDFYPKGKPGQAAWAGPEWVGRLTIKPDFIQAAGKPGLSFSPGSPDWADFFSLIPASHEPAGTTERARKHKMIWAESREVRLRDFQITKIEWPEGEFTSILRDYAGLERPTAKTAQTRAVAPKKTKVNPFDALAESKTKLNPFDAVTENKVATTKPNPFEEGERKVSENAPNTHAPAGDRTQTSSTSTEAHSTQDSNTRVFYAVVRNSLSPPFPREHSFHFGPCNKQCEEAEAKDSANFRIFAAFPKSKGIGILAIEWPAGAASKNPQFEVIKSGQFIGQISNLKSTIGRVNFEYLDSWSRSVAAEIVSAPPEFRGFSSKILISYFADHAGAISDVERSGWRKVDVSRPPMKLKAGTQ